MLWTLQKRDLRGQRNLHPGCVEFGVIAVVAELRPMFGISEVFVWYLIVMWWWYVVERER
jgi:hypothetical protein